MRNFIMFIIMWVKNQIKEYIWWKNLKKISKVMTTFENYEPEFKFWHLYKPGIRSAPSYGLHYIHRGHRHRKAA